LVEVLAEISNKLPVDDSGPFSDLDRVLSWVGDTLVGLGTDSPMDAVRDVLGRFNSPVLRIRAWQSVENKIERAYRSATPPWFEQVTAALVKQAADNFLEHLKQGDDAPEGFGVGYQVYFVLRHEDSSLREAVRELIESGGTHVSVLASRLTSARTASGITPDWQLSPDFDQQTFNQLAPPGDDAWYDETIQDVDARDLSWANRRKFAAGRVDRPPQPSVPEKVAGDEGLEGATEEPADAQDRTS
ncbi:hypothetical protein, partial [Pseudactinotalea sp.]|uniref:hypothetical protein n=1 Tax=Pseudactinotalea sp. TaxID=1926260 RepID=UPI003B3BDE20